LFAPRPHATLTEVQQAIEVSLHEILGLPLDDLLDVTKTYINADISGS
jgi:hypothetical protein